MNHDKHFADGEASTNWAESCFARLDRAEKGVFHRISGRYFIGYANEMSWREDIRRHTDQDKFNAVAHLMTRGGMSRQ